MTPLPCQRWTERRARYRPAGECIDPARHTVAEIDHAPARSFVQRHHYSGTWPSVSRAWGLYRDRGPVWSPELVGVCALGVPADAYRWAWSEVPALPALPALPYPRRPVDAVESAPPDSTQTTRPSREVTR